MWDLRLLWSLGCIFWGFCVDLKYCRPWRFEHTLSSSTRCLCLLTGLIPGTHLPVIAQSVTPRTWICILPVIVIKKGDLNIEIAWDVTSCSVTGTNVSNDNAAPSSVKKTDSALIKNVASRGQFTLKTEAAGPLETLALCTKQHGVTLMPTAVVHSDLTWVRPLRCGSHFKVLVWRMCVATAVCGVI